MVKIEIFLNLRTSKCIPLNESRAKIYVMHKISTTRNALNIIGK